MGGMNTVALGMKIASARKAAGLTQAELAERVGTKQASISKIETGRVVPTLPVLDRIARAVGSPIVITLGQERTADVAERRRRVRQVLGDYEFNPWDRDPTDAEARSLEDDGLTRDSFRR